MSENEKKKSAGRANAVAAWEWFKSAAWLQVLLIVGIVVSVVVAIPFVVQAIVTAVNQSNCTFYEDHNISYEQLEKYLNGEDTSCNGVVGESVNSNFVRSEDKEGFVVLFYKDNCDGCSTMELGVETWYKNFNDNKDQGDGKLKFYTINCSWIPEDEDTASKEGTVSEYDNKYISLSEQQDVQQAIKDVYLAQDETHQYSAVTEDILNKNLDGENEGATLPTPLFVTFTKDKTASSYITDPEGLESNPYGYSTICFTTPTKVIFAPIGSLALSSYRDVATIMLDIYNFAIYRK